MLYRSGSGAAYGYDESGTDLYDPEKKPGAGRQYSRQENTSRLGLLGTGMMTSVGHTLRRRGISAREGRFTAEDILRAEIPYQRR